MAGGKPGTFARLAKVHNSVIENVRDSVSLPTAGNLIKICQHAGVSADYLLFGKKVPVFSPPPPRIVLLADYHQTPPGVQVEDYLAVPLVAGEIAAGHPREIPEEFVTDMVWICKQELGARQHHNLRAVKLAKDADSMAPLLRPGDIIILDPTEIPPHKPLNKKYIYAMRTEREGNLTVKRVRRVDPFWILLAENPDKDPILLPQTVDWNPFGGRVIWSWTNWVR
jgi:SOS-response transcriptional repressor LexA